MNKEELAAKLNGNQYHLEISHELAKDAKSFGLVVVFGASDDLIEFRGAINDELGCYGGGIAKVDKEGLLPDRDSIDDDDVLENFFSRRKTAKEIEAVWDRDGYSWIYETDIPHATFEIVEGAEKYCRGLVFALSDLQPSTTLTQG